MKMRPTMMPTTTIVTSCPAADVLALIVLPVTGLVNVMFALMDDEDDEV